VLVVDDEEAARQRILDLLKREPDIGAIDEATDGRMAVEAISSRRPDLVFLDVQMPEVDGLGVIDAVGASAMPLTVFVTAFDRHAIQAFEANALDYLLKPFSDERGMREFGQRMIRMFSPTGSEPLDRLVVKGGGRTRFLPVSELDWVEAAGVYVTLHAGGRKTLHRTSLTELESRLDARTFIRIHRSAIVNIERISHLEPVSHGEFEVVLKNGARLRLSRTYRAHLEQRLGQPL
jgi:two-component system LytT family response regulator